MHWTLARAIKSGSIKSGTTSHSTSLLLQSNRGLKWAVGKIIARKEDCGLSGNASKCVTLNINCDRKRKRWACDPEDIISIDGINVKAVSVIDKYKYLGIGIGVTKAPGKVMLDTLQELLHRVTRARLKPQQRIFILNTFLIP